jgi:hypothetical protein
MYNNKLIQKGPEKVTHHNYTANSLTWSKNTLISKPQVYLFTYERRIKYILTLNT